MPRQRPTDTALLTLALGFHGWEDQKGLGIAVVALMLGLIPVLVMLLFL